MEQSPISPQFVNSVDHIWLALMACVIESNLKAYLLFYIARIWMYIAKRALVQDLIFCF